MAKRERKNAEHEEQLNSPEETACNAQQQTASSVTAIATRSADPVSPVAFLLLSLPIILYGIRILATGGLLGIEDWDWFFSHHEAVRRSIMEYGQFPWWNPWSTGGTPLFADPQVGLISIQMPLVLMFGTVTGLKIGVVVYLLAGFWGMFFLLGMLSNDFYRKTLLSYLWISSTFVMFHYTAGHYTFLLYLLVPWLVYFYLQGMNSKGKLSRGGLVRFTLFAGFLVNSAPHYIALQTILWMAGLFVVMVYRNRDCLKEMAISHVAALFLILPMVAPKVFFAVTYLGDYPREPLTNHPIGIVEGGKALLMPGQEYSLESSVPMMGTWEISAYIGVLTMLLFLGLLGNHLLARIRKQQTNEAIFLVISLLAFLAFIIGLGPFAPMTPWSILSSLPVLENMQVPSRWFGWTLFFVVLAIGSAKTFPKWALIPLAISLVELTVFNVIREQPFVLEQEFHAEQSAEIFEQYDEYPRARPELIYTTMFFAMSQNYGEIRGYEPVLGYDMLNRQTARGGVNNGQHLLTDNAELLEWSPNRVHFTRTGPGPMIINANVGSWWTLNGDYMFEQMRVTEPTLEFALDENAPNDIILECKPQQSWLLYTPLLSVLGYLLLMLDKVRRPKEPQA